MARSEEKTLPCFGRPQSLIQRAAELIIAVLIICWWTAARCHLDDLDLMPPGAAAGDAPRSSWRRLRIALRRDAVIVPVVPKS